MMIETKPKGKEPEKGKKGKKYSNEKGKETHESEPEDAGNDDEFSSYCLPGQKYPAPADVGLYWEQGDGTRLFYETMYQQLPNNQMAQKYLLEHGLLSLDEVKKILKS